MSRIAHQEYYLTPEEKDHLVRLVRKVERFSSVQVLAYCVMSNHIHILVFLPERPETLPSDEDMLVRIAALYGETFAVCVKGEWARLEGLQKGLSNEDKAGYFARMYDVSEFMKAIKQRYTMSFNYENEHYGTMWEGRFKAVHVQPTMGPMAAVAAYDDLNPVRAGMVGDPMEYRWSSWFAAVNGDENARGAYRCIYQMQGAEWSEVADRHFGVMKDKAGYFLKASRAFIEGAAIGDGGFVEEYARQYFPKSRKSGPLKLPGGKVWGELRVAREVRVKTEYLGPLDDLGKGSDPMPNAAKF